MLKSKTFIITFLGSILLILVFVTTTMWIAYTSRSFTEETAGKVSEFYIEELALNRAKDVSEILRRNYGYLINSLKVITEEDLKSVKSLRSYLSKIKTLYGIFSISFIDDKGYIYNDYSTTTSHNSYLNLLSDSITEPVFCTMNLYGAKKQVILAVPVNNLSFLGNELKICYVQIDIDAFLKGMTGKIEGMETFSNLYYKNGECLTNSSFGTFGPGKNFLTELSKDETKIEGKSSEEIVEDFMNGREGFVSVVHDGQESLIYYVPVENASWYLTVSIYNNVITEHIYSITSRIIKNSRTQLILLSFLAILLAFQIIYLVKRNDHITLKKQASISEEQLMVIDALCKDYINVSLINPENGETRFIQLDKKYFEVFDSKTDYIFDYDLMVSRYIGDKVYTEDVEYVKKAMSLPVVIKNLEKSDEYVSSYRIIENQEIHFYQFIFLKLRNKNIVGAFKNIDELVNAAKERETLITLSETDLMTKLFNRVFGERKVTESLKSGKGGFFILLDIDKFKHFNDTYGHGVGDKVIISVAELLKQSFRDDDIVFRLGGDEFSAYASSVHSKKDAERIISRFFKKIEEIHIDELGDCPPTVSLGAIVIPSGEKKVFSTVYKSVDECLYQSKKLSGNAVTFVE